MNRQPRIAGHREKGIWRKRVIVKTTSFPTNTEGNVRLLSYKPRFRVKRFSKRIVGEMVKDASTGLWKTEPVVITARKFEEKDQIVREYLEYQGYEFPRCAYVVAKDGEMVDIVESRDAACEKLEEIEPDCRGTASFRARVYYETEDGREYRGRIEETDDEVADE